MAENSKIEWTHHTFNPWRGCSKVSPGCEHCYAATQSLRNPATLGKWGPNGTRVVASETMWREPIKWDAKAKAAGERHRVFCASMADVFEDWQGPMLNSNEETLYLGNENRPNQWFSPGADEYAMSTMTRKLMMSDVRRRLFALIDATPNLDWLILTKRPENIARMMAEIDSTGYNKANATQASRATGLSGGSGPRTGDRLSGPGLENCEENSRQVDGRREDDAMQTSSRRTGERLGLLASSGDEGRQKALRSGSSLSVDSLQWTDLERGNDQPQGREQGEQQPEQFGVGNLQSAKDARDRGTRREALGLQGQEPPEDISNRSGRENYSAAASERRADQGYRSELRNEAESGQRNLLPSHLDSHLKIRPNVWLGVSVENQEQADKRIPILLQTPAAVRFLSCEPLLGPVDLGRAAGCDPTGIACEGHQYCRPLDISWVIVGGESGHGARPCNYYWLKSIVDQCQAAAVPVFVKQWGARPFFDKHDGGKRYDDHTYHKLNDRKSGDISEWPEDLRVREFPKTEATY